MASKDRGVIPLLGWLLSFLDVMNYQQKTCKNRL